MLCINKYIIVFMGKYQKTWNRGIIQLAQTAEKKHKIESPSVLYQEYDWFKKLFPLGLQKSADDFFLPGLRCELVGVSKNINLLQTKEGYFVTKIRIDKFYDMYLRISELAIPMLLNKGLGKSGRPFDINKLTKLEQNVLTGFNDYVYKIIVQFFDPPPVVNFVRTNFDITHLTFVIRDEDTNKAGRFIVSVPDGRISPQKIIVGDDKFDYDDFSECHTNALIRIGKTRFSVMELKDLDPGDLVILEESDIRNLTLYINDEVKNVLIEPNMNIEFPFNESNGGDGMANEVQAKNLWDSIEVDMYAELDPVKISLGDLKKIEQGLVVDVAAIYENKVTLRVENKVIGHGELVIVNDRYGVKVTDIVQKAPAPKAIPSENPARETQQTEEIVPAEGSAEDLEGAPADETLPEEGAPAGNDEEEFDYSDFELEDEDI